MYHRTRLGWLRKLTPKSLDIVGYPLQAHSLVKEAQVRRAIGQDLLAGHKAESSHAVVDGDKNERLALVDGLVKQICSIVHGSPSKL
jgi:hypothetical protein